MTETFTELSVIGDTVSDEDRVVLLLASLPESFGVLVTALEASTEVPTMETVTEHLLREEQKMKSSETSRDNGEKAMYAGQKGAPCVTAVDNWATSSVTARVHRPVQRPSSLPPTSTKMAVRNRTRLTQRKKGMNAMMTRTVIL